jgi:glutaminyl-peptide cyclotransferase
MTNMRKSRLFIILSIFILLSAMLTVLIPDHISPSIPFDGNRAYQDVITQVGFGPRIPDSQAHAKTIAYIQDELRKANWQTKLQTTTWRGFSIKNIIASTADRQPEIILGAHYDSRLLADQDPAIGQNAPVPGANDGASGVGILLELARSLPRNSPPIWLVFFDAEDNGGINGRDWIMGSEAFVSDLTFHPRAAIIVDMVGDANLDIYIENNSNATLVSEIWGQAARLGYEKQFIPTIKYSMLDDHTPFLEAGIPAVDIIDFDYPYWHTAADTPDKVSPTSLKIVGDTLRTWIINQK